MTLLFSFEAATWEFIHLLINISKKNKICFEKFQLSNPNSNISKIYSTKKHKDI